MESTEQQVIAEPSQTTAQTETSPYDTFIENNELSDGKETSADTGQVLDEIPEEVEQEQEQTDTEVESEIESEGEKSFEIPQTLETEEGLKLIKVELPNGEYIYSTEDKAEQFKKGYLMQSDYTAKTMAIAEDRKKLESELQQATEIKQKAETQRILELLKIETELEEPLESEYVDSLADDDEQREQRQAFREARKVYANQKDMMTQYKANREKIVSENNTTFTELQKEIGDEEYKKFIPVLDDYYKKIKLEDFFAVPKELPKLLYKAMNLEKTIELEKKKWLEEYTGKKKAIDAQKSSSQKVYSKLTSKTNKESSSAYDTFVNNISDY